MAKVVVYEENRLETVVKRVCELENYVLNLETKYLSKSRGLSIAESVDDVHCVTRFLHRLKVFLLKNSETTQSRCFRVQETCQTGL